MMKILAGAGMLGTLSVVVIVLLLQAQQTQTLLVPQAAVGGNAPASIPQIARTSDARVGFQALLLSSKIELELEGGTLDQGKLVAALAAAQPQAKIGEQGGTLVRVLPDGHSVLFCAAAGAHAAACEADDLMLSRRGQATASSAHAAAAAAVAALTAAK